MTPNPTRLTGVAAGVPFLAVPPESGPRPSAPVVVAWHLLDPPRTEAAFAAAVPLAGLDAWRIYLGLPLSGSRLPAGGRDELMRLGYEDAVLNLQGPISHQAAEEFAPALADLRTRLDLGNGPIGVLGGSMGAAIALLTLAEGIIDIRAAVLVSPLVQLRPAVEAMEKRFGVIYQWSDPSHEVARRLDFVARADQIAQRGEPAVLLLVGEEDDPECVGKPAERMREALASRYADPTRVELITVPGMAHALADEPGTEPAPQTRPAAAVDRHAVGWLGHHLALPPEATGGRQQS
ncbi:MAG: alpha/beta hydrolase family protein [Candidatus Dormibacteria bacterium]